MPRPKVHDDELRGRLLELAGARISEAGPDGVTLRRLAQDAGTSTTAVYSLFGDKAALLAAVHAEAFDRFAAHLADVVTGDDPVEDLARLGRAYRASAHADPHFYGVMFGPGTLLGRMSAQEQERAWRTFRPLVAAVERARDAGLLRAPEPERVASALWATVHGLVSLELVGLLPAAGTGDSVAAVFDDAIRAAIRGWAVA